MEARRAGREQPPGLRCQLKKARSGESRPGPPPLLAVSTAGVTDRAWPSSPLRPGVASKCPPPAPEADGAGTRREALLGRPKDAGDGQVKKREVSGVPRSSRGPRECSRCC